MRRHAGQVAIDEVACYYLSVVARRAVGSKDLYNQPLGRGGRQYLPSQGRHCLGRTPMATISFSN